MSKKMRYSLPGVTYVTHVHHGYVERRLASFAVIINVVKIYLLAWFPIYTRARSQPLRIDVTHVASFLIR